MSKRRAVKAEQDVYFADISYLGDARRFDMGERDHFISMEMASMGMELVTEWGSAAIAQRLAMLTGRLADGLSAADVRFPQTHLRAPHILSVSFPRGMPDKLIEGLAAQDIFVARRIGRMRISPHVYNDEGDIDRFIEAFRRLLA